jgi:hypothetical protein
MQLDLVPCMLQLGVFVAVVIYILFWINIRCSLVVGYRLHEGYLVQVFISAFKAVAT